MTPLLHHLWQSTLCLGAAWLVTRALRGHSARIRHAIWLAASLKFLVPFAWLIALGSYLPGPVIHTAPPALPAAQIVSAPLALSTAAPETLTIAAASTIPWIRILSIVWIAGSISLLLTYWIRWRQLARALLDAHVLNEGREIDALHRVRDAWPSTPNVDVACASASIEPGVVGFLNPRILWPVNLSSHLSDRELDGIFAHELAHVRRRDNVASAMHLAVKTIFWFHPGVWWIETRLIDERERACDEDVLRFGSEPVTYARGILKVCEFCLRSPLACAAGVTSSNLNQRVEAIMTAGIVRSLGPVRQTLLTAAGLALVAGPLFLGSIHAAPMAVAPDAHITPARPATPTSALTRAMDVAPTPHPNVQTGTAIAPKAQRPIAPGAQTNQPAAPATADESQLWEQLNRNPRAATYLDMARMYLQQGRRAEAEAMTTMALDAMRRESAPRNAASTSLLDNISAQSAGRIARPVSAPNAEFGNTARVGGDIKEPRKIKDVKPVYPQVAMAAHIQGIVIVEISLGEDGQVQETRILRGQPLLNQAAIDAVSQWRFEPTLRDGVPVPLVMTVTVNFALPTPMVQ